jgi:drug/metabolite transporter (DMT)-like permease
MATAPADTTTEADSAPIIGIAFMCAGVFCLTVNDVFAKWLGAIYPVPEVAFLRMLFALPLIVAAACLFGGAKTLATRRPLAQVGRGLLATSATLTFYPALTLLPLAEVTAIAFTAPLFVTMLALPLLGERPGPTQWVVTCIGFLGVLLIVRPGGLAFTPAALIPLGTALSYALLMLTARMLGRSETIWATMLYATLVPLVITGAMMPWYWEAPSLTHLPHFIALGFSGGLALTLITQGFRIGIASVVAPFDYTGLIWATMFGWVIWGEMPSGLSILGGIVIGVCGIYLAYRQTRDARRRRAVEPLHPPRGD